MQSLTLSHWQKRLNNNYKKILDFCLSLVNSPYLCLCSQCVAIALSPMIHLTSWMHQMHGNTNKLNALWLSIAGPSSVSLFGRTVSSFLYVGGKDHSDFLFCGSIFLLIFFLLIKPLLSCSKSCNCVKERKEQELIQDALYIWTYWLTGRFVELLSY